MSKLITAEVAYATPSKQKIISLELADGTSALQAIMSSGICEHFPEINLDSMKVGIFGKKIADPNSYKLQHKDRVEIYRPLIIDPKESRVNRVNKLKKEKENIPNQ